MSQQSSQRKHLQVIHSNTTLPSKRYQLKDQDNQEQKAKKIGIDVLCRIRPRFNNESYVQYQLQPEFFRSEIEIFENKQGIIKEACNSKKFRFTKVFDQNTTQLQVQETYVSKLLMEMFEQKKCGLIFSYGMTNSGKTYTIVGNEGDPGILPQTLLCLIEMKRAVNNGAEKFKIGERIIHLNTIDNHLLYDLEIYFQSYEIYNEEIFDLLYDKKLNKDKSKLQIKEIGERKFTVKDAIERLIKDEDDLDKTLDICLSNRQMGETVLNMSSSRSHTIFKINVHFVYKNLINDENMILKSSICIVDLAGSERAKKAETQGTQLLEACNINKSLLVLGRCLKQMQFSDPETTQIIPFRECKLTRILCEYFTEDNNLLMIVNIKLTQDDLEETLKVLHYGAMGVHINLLKSKLLDSTLSFQQRLQKQQSSKKNDLFEEIKDDPNLIEQDKRGQFMKTVQIVDNIRYICRINQEIMVAEQDDQMRRVKSFSDRLMSGDIQIKKISSFKTQINENQNIDLRSKSILDRKLSSLIGSKDNQINQIPIEPQLSDILSNLTITQKSSPKIKNDEQNLIEYFDNISLDVQNNVVLEQSDANVIDLNYQSLDLIAQDTEKAPEDTFYSLLHDDILPLSDSLLEKEHTLQEENLVLAPLAEINLQQVKKQSQAEHDTPNFENRIIHPLHSFGSQKIDTEFKYKDATIQLSQIKLNRDEINQQYVNEIINDEILPLVVKAPSCKKFKFDSGPPSIFLSLFNLQEELCQDRSKFMKKALASVKSKTKNYELIQNFNLDDPQDDIIIQVEVDTKSNIENIPNESNKEGQKPQKKVKKNGKRIKKH